MMHELLWDAANVDTSASQACTSTTKEGKQPHPLAEVQVGNRYMMILQPAHTHATIT